MKINYSDSNLKSNNDIFFSRIYNNSNYNRSEYNFSSIYLYFSTSHGIAFFSTRREEHYQIMNDTVFHALVLIPYDKDYDEYDFINTQREINLIISSTVYKHASLHMEKDKPSLPKKIDNLNKELKKHNSQVKEVYKLIDNIISDSFRKPSSPVSQIFYKINKGDIKELAGKSWKYVFKNVIESENIQKFESNIDDYINNHHKKNEI